jgi:hypothetical protein
MLRGQEAADLLIRAIRANADTGRLLRERFPTSEAEIQHDEPRTVDSGLYFS